MGNILSCCCRANPCDHPDEGQRLLNEGIQSPQTSIKVSEGDPVSPDCATAESSKTPSPTNDQATDQSKPGLLLEASQPEVVSGLAALQEPADALSTQVKPEASAVVTNEHVNEASAQDKSTLFDQQKVVAGVVSKILADASKIVASESIVQVTGEGEVTLSTAPQTQDVSTGRVENQGVFLEKMEGKTISTMTDSQNVSVGIESPATSTTTESQTASTAIESQAVPTEKLENQDDSTVIETQAVSTEKLESKAASTVMESQAASILVESKPASTLNESQAVSTGIRDQAVSTGIESQTTSTMTETQAAATESQAVSTVPESQAASVEKLNLDMSLYTQDVLMEKTETPGCSVKVETQNVSAEMIETISLMTPVEKETVAELQQNVMYLNGSVAEESDKFLSAGFGSALPLDHLTEDASSKMLNSTEGLPSTVTETFTKEEGGVKSDDAAISGSISIEEVADDIIVPQTDLSTIPPAAKLADLLLVQNPSTEVVNEAPEGMSPSTETDEQLDIFDHQELQDPSAALDSEQFCMKGPDPESGLELCQAPTDTSANSEKSSVDKNGIPKDSNLREEPCNGEDLTSSLPSVTTEKAVKAENRGSSADSVSQDGVFGLSTGSSPDDLLEGKETVKSQMSKQDKLDEEEKSIATGICDGELVVTHQDERPEKANRLSPVSDGLGNSEQDLYRGEEEIEEELERQKLEEILGCRPITEDRCSLEQPVTILVYSEREWKGQTAKCAVIKKGYSVLSQSFGCLRRVRGDNYCALRATLYQALMNTTQLPDWLQQESFLLIPEELEARFGLIKEWVFTDLCKQTSGIQNAVDVMKHYLRLLLKWWQAAAASPELEARRRVCEQLFQGGEDEFGLMEALKLLMLARAVELHAAMQTGDDVPIFCWLLFARDTSSCPRTFLANHLSQVGFNGGMEQVEMFLLGYALCHTIKVYRLYMADTEEFITHYPDDHIQDWPCVCLVTEDDRHYNVAVGEPTCLQEDLSEGPP